MRCRKLGIAALAITTVVGAIAAAPDADARYWRRGGGWVGPAVVGGLALGALAASPYAYGGYGAYGAYGGGYYGCPRRVVGYTEWGRPIVRRVCY